MRARPAKNADAVTLALALVVGAFTGGCRHCPAARDGSRLDISLTVLESPEKIEEMVRASLAEKYSVTNMAEGYSMYQITNGPAHWVFVLAANAPRGLGMFNLYCYEQEQPEAWLLRSYVPIYPSPNANSVDRKLHILIVDDHVNVAFRGVVVFTTASQREITGPVPPKKVKVGS